MSTLKPANNQPNMNPFNLPNKTPHPYPETLYTPSFYQPYKGIDYYHCKIMDFITNCMIKESVEKYYWPAQVDTRRKSYFHLNQAPIPLQINLLKVHYYNIMTKS